jgi:hypothetical protein
MVGDLSSNFHVIKETLGVHPHHLDVVVWGAID